MSDNLTAEERIRRIDQAWARTEEPDYLVVLPPNYIAEWEQMMANLRTAGSADQPRDPAGSPTGGQWVSSGGFAHTGIEWKQTTGKDGRPIPIKVKSIEEAITLIHEGKVVELEDTRTAFTLIKKLAEMAQEAKAAGKEAKNYDLCQVAVAGTNLFCAESLRNEKYPEGIPRIEMPQLGGKAIPGSEADKLPRNKEGEVNGSAVFINHLQSIGMKTVRERVPASMLKASQRELKGNTVGAMMNNKDYDPGAEPIFVSTENGKAGYVIDGHHRFAASLGRDLEDGRLGDSMMNVIRVNAPISEVLQIASAWSMKFGIAQAAGVAKQMKASGIHK